MIIRILALLLLIPIIIILIAVLINIIPLPYFLDDSRQLIAAVLAGIVSFIYLVGITIYIINSFRQLGRVFDKIAEDIGLRKQDFRYFGKRYKGILQDRDLVIEYFPPRFIQGALLNIYLSCSQKIPAVISKKAPILESRAGMDPAYELEYGFYVFSPDRKDISKIFSDSTFLNAVNKILQRGNRRHTLQVFFRNNEIYLRSRLAHLGPEDLRIFINSLEVMAGIMENKQKSK